jgi:hypothetical protein
MRFYVRAIAFDELLFGVESGTQRMSGRGLRIYARG